MKMIIAIVREKYREKLLDKFLDENIMITKVSSVGGFLKWGSTTIILSAKEDDLEKINNIFAQCVDSEEVEHNGNSYTVSGANVFVVDLEKQIKV